jgi:16S rRNA (cytosine967-C5)-methyltransferase
MKISPARTAAFDVLLRIENDRAFSSVLLPAFEEGLSPADRALCHELVLGTLRRQIYLDRLIDTLSGGKRIDTAVRIAVRLGIYQLLYLDRIPDHSAVNESVNLIQRAKKTSAKGFVNAILRRAARELPALGHADDLHRLSVETSHPRWLLEKWIEEFGWDEAALIADANNQVPAQAFRSIDGRPVNVRSAIPSKFVEGCYLLSRDSDAAQIIGSDDLYFQDEGSQMVAAAVRVPAGGRFLDVCASPGGKTGYIASHAPDGYFIAGDLYWQRVEMLRENCRRQKVDVQVLQYDAENSLPFHDSSFQSVFVDAPCSGTGTIRHNPEIRYFLSPGDFPLLAKKQRAILKNASKLVTHGGSLIYSTCSLESGENEEICREFLDESNEFDLVRPNVPERFLTPDGFARTFPHRDGMDGFFIAEFHRG